MSIIHLDFLWMEIFMRYSKSIFWLNIKTDLLNINKCQMSSQRKLVNHMHEKTIRRSTYCIPSRSGHNICCHSPKLFNSLVPLIYFSCKIECNGPKFKSHLQSKCFCWIKFCQQEIRILELCLIVTVNIILLKKELHNYRI